MYARAPHMCLTHVQITLHFILRTGFIIVAACVMTFEARDSASKVVPARFKLNYGKHDGSSRSSNADRRPTGNKYIFNTIQI